MRINQKILFTSKDLFGTIQEIISRLQQYELTSDAISSLEEINGKESKEALAKILSDLVNGKLILTDTEVEAFTFSNHSGKLLEKWNNRLKVLPMLNRAILEDILGQSINNVRKQVQLHFLLRRFKEVFRVKTARFRAHPSFIIVGVQKAGTTSLYNYLIQHNSIKPASKKEPHFFHNPENLKSGLKKYRKYFPLKLELMLTKIRTGEAMTGEASPLYWFYPHSFEAIKKSYPRMKIIVILRDPVERAKSQYMHNKMAEGDREPRDLDDAVIASLTDYREELARIQNGEALFDPQIHTYSYAFHGVYAFRLKKLIQLFGEQNVLILKSEDLFRNTYQTVSKTFAFLELPSMPESQLDLKNFYGSNLGLQANSKRIEAKPEFSKETEHKLHRYFEEDQLRVNELINTYYAKID